MSDVQENFNCLKADLEDQLNDLRVAEDNAKKATAEAARFADEMRQEKDRVAQIEKLRRGLESQVWNKRFWLTLTINNNSVNKTDKFMSSRFCYCKRKQKQFLNAVLKTGIFLIYTSFFKSSSGWLLPMTVLSTKYEFICSLQYFCDCVRNESWTHMAGS